MRKVGSVQVWKSDQAFQGSQETADFMKHEPVCQVKNLNLPVFDQISGDILNFYT